MSELVRVGLHECVTCPRCACTFAAVHPACPRCSEAHRSEEQLRALEEALRESNEAILYSLTQSVLHETGGTTRNGNITRLSSDAAELLRAANLTARVTLAGAVLVAEEEPLVCGSLYPGGHGETRSCLRPRGHRGPHIYGAREGT